MVKEQKGGIGNEKWWQSRRMQSAILSGAALALVIGFPEKYDIIVAAASGLAGMLGVSSWVKPKRS